MKTTARKIVAHGTPYTIISVHDKDGQVVHHLELNPPVTTRNLRVLTMHGRLGPRTLQLLAEAYDQGFTDGFFEKENLPESQRTYLEDEDFSIRHKNQRN